MEFLEGLIYIKIIQLFYMFPPFPLIKKYIKKSRLFNYYNEDWSPHPNTPEHWIWIMSNSNSHLESLEYVNPVFDTHLVILFLSSNHTSTKRGGRVGRKFCSHWGQFLMLKMVDNGERGFKGNIKTFREQRGQI